MNERTTSSPIPEKITTDLSCVSCGYNMKTLAVDSQCPECGRAVMETLGAWRSVAVKPELVRSMAQQAAVLLWMPVAAFVSTIAGLCMGAPGISLVGLLICTMVHLVAAATFVGAAENALGSRHRKAVVTTGAAIFGLGVVAAFVVGSPALIFLMFPVAVTSASVYCTRYAAQVTGAAGPDELKRFGGGVFRLTQATSAAASTLFPLALLAASGILPVDDNWLFGFVLFCVAISTLILMVGWMVFHMVLMFRMKRWLGHALVGLEFFDSAGEDEPESEGQRPGGTE